MLSDSRGLTTLNLARNPGLGAAGAAALAPGVSAATLASLAVLRLSECGLGPEGAAALAGAALRPGSVLETLELADNEAGTQGAAAALAALCGAAGSRVGLVNLGLERNRVRGTELADALQAAVAAAGGAAAPGGLRLTAPRLAALRLASNSLYDAGAALLEELLGGAKALAELDVRSNGVGDAGAAQLLRLLAPPPPAPPLQALLLDGNRLHNAGGQALLQALAAAPGCWRFSAEGNKVRRARHRAGRQA
jgi:Ran GTPase-activating protein (RanGAP) involved in mRNA processing and transport